MWVFTWNLTLVLFAYQAGYLLCFRPRAWCSCNITLWRISLSGCFTGGRYSSRCNDCCNEFWRLSKRAPFTFQLVQKHFLPQSTSRTVKCHLIEVLALVNVLERLEYLSMDSSLNPPRVRICTTACFMWPKLPRRTRLHTSRKVWAPSWRASRSCWKMQRYWQHCPRTAWWKESGNSWRNSTPWILP